ncbi:MAG TPA: RES family NAD+ phosphorylase [Thermoanaerobaculia bacterium]|nr:RES family NAD+ phosphorylase [Thermoanaerobaculia bacterium]
MLTACRIVKPRHVEDAFSGEGARIHGGRWNSRGNRMVYTASTVSLATLELLVHLPLSEWVRSFAVVHCWFPEALVEELDRKRLPRDWHAYPPPARLQQLGNEWLQSRASAVLAVPSAVIHEELNYLLNPEHPDSASIDVGEARAFRLDPRLIT